MGCFSKAHRFTLEGSPPPMRSRSCGVSAAYFHSSRGPKNETHREGEPPGPWSWPMKAIAGAFLRRHYKWGLPAFMRKAMTRAVSSVLLIALSGCTSSALRARDVPGEDAAVDVTAPHQSDRCLEPRTLRLIEGEVVVRADTTSGTDEFSGLDCGSRGTVGPLNGPQHYYLVSVRAGATYSFILNATFHSVLYGFDAGTECSRERLQSACRSDGPMGFTSGLINPGTGGPNPGVVFDMPPDFTPEEDMEVIVVVDSDGASGAYELTVRETLP